MFRRGVVAVARPLLRQHRQHSALPLIRSSSMHEALIGSHPFSSFDQTLAGFEATEEMSASRVADATKRVLNFYDATTGRRRGARPTCLKSPRRGSGRGGAADARPAARRASDPRNARRLYMKELELKQQFEQAQAARPEGAAGVEK